MRPFRRVERFFTTSELAFYEKLYQAVNGRFVIMSKVRLLDLVQPEGDEQERFAGKGRVAQKHIDFVLLLPATYEVVAAIELDGSSHARSMQLRRDEQKARTLESVGIPLLRFSSLEVPTPELIWQRLQPLTPAPAPAPAPQVPTPTPVSGAPEAVPQAAQKQAPVCKKCGRIMVLKQKDKGPFWACPGFPQCRNVFPA
ncbi:MAG TPA: DUF2726 domain-containing protein [Symbiobacteriaceae bacterium]|nr:DUF2726 domain-containing protein [Symbiobacteriaceae bacterium]